MALFSSIAAIVFIGALLSLAGYLIARMFGDGHGHPRH